MYLRASHSLCAGAAAFHRLVPCASKTLSTVIGRKGTTIRYIQEQTNCSFSLDRDAKPDPLICVLAPTEDACAAGERHVLEVIEKGTPVELQVLESVCMHACAPVCVINQYPDHLVVAAAH